MYMRLESIIWTLKCVSEGKDTLYLLSKEKSRGVYSYLKYCVNNGFLEQYTDGNKKPYRLTKKGKKFVKLVGCEEYNG